MNSIFTNAVELKEKINNFIDYCKDNDLNITVTRLAWFLGTNRVTLDNYIKSKDIPSSYVRDIKQEEKGEIIKLLEEIKAYIEAEYEDKLFNKNSTVGAIFTLKNNYDWKDKLDIDSNTTVTNSVDNLSVEELRKLIEKGESEATGEE